MQIDEERLNILITGGCGFIGSNLTRHLLKNFNCNIRIFDNLSIGSVSDLGSDFSPVLCSCKQTKDWVGLQVFKADILDFDHLLSASAGADLIIHLAANTGVAPSIENPVNDCQTNVFGTLNVLESCRLNHIKRMIFASSGAPLGEQVPPLHEELAPKPMSPYGASKLAGEGYCSAYYHSYGIQTTCLRFGNVYGPGSMRKGSVIAKFIKKSLNKEPLEVFGTGEQTRDYIYIDDLSRAISASIISEKSGGQIFQIATAKETSILELINALNRALHKNGLDITDVNHLDMRVGDAIRNYSDTSKAIEYLDWRPTICLDDGLSETVKYFLEN
jgi:UDP-glucose 4-epimerase